MIFRKAYKFRLYPNKEQQDNLAVQFGHARFVYNHLLSARKEHYKATGKGLSCNATIKLLPALKKADGTKWLGEADSQVLQQKAKDLDTAYKNFFTGRAKYPNFKKKHGTQSIRYPQRFKLDGNRIYLPKVGKVKIKLHRGIDGVMKNATVSKTKSGKYFVSIQCEMELNTVPNEKPPVGVDLGLKDFAALSTGEKIAHPANLRKSEKRLARLQRKLSKKKKGSNNRAKARLKVARLHEHVANQRKDFVDKLSHRLTTEYGLVALENLNVKGMVKNHCLAKSISDSGWSMFSRRCEYKAVLNGSEVKRVDRFFPSSKLCRHCGTINKDLKLHHRFWVCDNCGVEHDRDISAAINILNFCTVGAAGSQACGEDVSLGIFHDDKQTSAKQEAQRL